MAKITDPIDVFLGDIMDEKDTAVPLNLFGDDTKQESEEDLSF
jgi:hypothetical protein